MPPHVKENNWIAAKSRTGRVQLFSPYTTRLAERGATVTGIDFSENSIKYAKLVAEQKGLNPAINADLHAGR